MTNPKSLSERLREAELSGPDRPLLTEAADALDAITAQRDVCKDLLDYKNVELKEAADALDAKDALLAQAAAALEQIVDIGDASSGSDRGDLVASREIARKALAAIRAKEHP